MGGERKRQKQNNNNARQGKNRATKKEDKCSGCSMPNKNPAKTNDTKKFPWKLKILLFPITLLMAHPSWSVTLYGEGGALSEKRHEHEDFLIIKCTSFSSGFSTKHAQTGWNYVLILLFNKVWICSQANTRFQSGQLHTFILFFNLNNFTGYPFAQDIWGKQYNYSQSLAIDMTEKKTYCRVQNMRQIHVHELLKFHVTSVGEGRSKVFH